MSKSFTWDQELRLDTNGELAVRKLPKELFVQFLKGDQKKRRKPIDAFLSVYGRDFTLGLWDLIKKNGSASIYGMVITND